MQTRPQPYGSEGEECATQHAKRDNTIYMHIAHTHTSRSAAADDLLFYVKLPAPV